MSGDWKLRFSFRSWWKFGADSFVREYGSGFGKYSFAAEEFWEPTRIPGLYIVWDESQ